MPFSFQSKTLFSSFPCSNSFTIHFSLGLFVVYDFHFDFAIKNIKRKENLEKSIRIELFGIKRVFCMRFKIFSLIFFGILRILHLYEFPIQFFVCMRGLGGRMYFDSFNHFSDLDLQAIRSIAKR